MFFRTLVWPSLFLLLPPLSAQVKEVAAYRFDGALDEVTRREARLALPSLRFHRPLPTALRLKPVAPEELAHHSTKPMATRAGIHRNVSMAAALDSGRWDLAADGRAVWRMALQSPGAAGVRIHFRDFRLHAGGRLWLHDGSGAESEIMGPYEERGVYGDGDFWSDFVLSDTIVVEYRPGLAGNESLPFNIAEISHLLPGVVPGVTSQDGAAEVRGGGVGTLSNIVQSLISPLAWAGSGADPRQAAATCNLDISCFPEWAETARSVAHFVFEEDNSSYVCSGTLLRTTTANNIPYLLTADHCIGTDAIARSVQSFWMYQTSRCNGPAANKRDAQRTLGARYLVSEGVARGDYSLVRLNSVPSGVIFSGWSTEAVDLGTPLVGIHHPTGDYKRFSRGVRATTGSQLAGANPAFYYTVAYNEGLIEGGSSGSGLFRAPGVVVGMLSSGPKTETPCDFRPYPANYGRFSDAFPQLREYLEGRTTENPNPPPPTGATGPAVLTSGVSRDYAVGPVESATLLNGALGYAIDVPQGATRLEIRIASVGAEPQLGFWVRYESAPAVQSGRVVADHVSPATSGFEVVTIDARSNPALRSGRYYIALGLFSTNTTARGTITATITGGAPAPTTNQLVSGQARAFSIGPVATGTLINGAGGFRIEVPEGARRLDIRLAATRPELDIDLHVRFGQDVGLNGTNIVSDHTSTTDTGVEELSLTQASSPPLRAGTYYVAIGLFARNVVVAGTITATITGAAGPVTGNALVSGTPVVVTIPAVTSNTLRTGALAYQIFVPAGATKLDVRLSNGTAGIDYDLFVRRNTAPEVVSGAVVSDYNSAGAAGDEFISITPASTPPLIAGSTYYIAIGVFTLNRAGTVTLTAAVTAPTAPPTTPPGGTATGTRLTPGTPAPVRIPSTDTARLLAGQSGYYVTVPQGTQRLELQLATAQQVDLDLFVRAATPPTVQDGKVQAEYRATGPTGNETVTITGSAAQPLSGTYYVGIGVFTTGVDITATLSAIAQGGAASGPVVLQSGVTQTFSLAAAANAQLAGQQYAVDVPANAVRLELRLSSPTPGVDLDLYARLGEAPAVSAGKVQADHSSEGATASEVITITPSSDPALRAGRYFVALGVFSTGVAIDGLLVATVVTSGGGATPPPAGSRVITPQSPVKFSLPAVESSTVFIGDYSFRVVVPQGTRSMQLRLTADAPSIDTDLYARYEADVDVADGRPVADHAAESDSGNELLTIGPSSEPVLRAGTYYVALGLFARNTPATGTISVTFERDLAPPAPPASSGRVLSFGQPAQFVLPAVTSSTLLNGDFAYRINVPSGGRLDVVMKAADAAVDVDLFLRAGAEPTLDAGRVVADYRAQGDTGDETLVVTSASTPPLRAGTYFVAFGLFTLNREARGALTATFTPDSQPAGGLLKQVDLTPELLAAPEDELLAKPGKGSMHQIEGKGLELKKRRGPGGLDKGPLVRRPSSAD